MCNENADRHAARATIEAAGANFIPGDEVCRGPVLPLAAREDVVRAVRQLEVAGRILHAVSHDLAVLCVLRGHLRGNRR